MQARILAATVAAASLLVAAPAHAELKQVRRVDLSTPVKRLVSEMCTRAAVALIRGDYASALTIAELAITTAPGDPWAHYDRAVALTHLGRLDEADSEFRAAQARFAANDEWGQSVAIYGRAHALAEQGRCQQADQAFDEYARLVGKDAPAAAAMARAYENDCKLPGVAAQLSTRDVRVMQAELALAVAWSKEQYARAALRWAAQAEQGLIVAPGGSSKLDRVRARARRVESTAKRDERAARETLRRERMPAVQR